MIIQFINTGKSDFDLADFNDINGIVSEWSDTGIGQVFDCIGITLFAVIRAVIVRCIGSFYRIV